MQAVLRLYCFYYICCMRKIVLLSFALLSYTVNAQKNHNYTIGFYNVENLFDTLDDPEKNDAEFLPEGKNQWTEERYAKKLADLNKVINEMGNLLVLGMAEIENERVIRDLLKVSNYSGTHGVVHFESPDDRGIDVGLIYDSLKLKLADAGKIRFIMPGMDRPTTRDILWAKFSYKKDTVYCMVNHWPSRRGGQETSEPNRMEAAKQARKFIDSVLLRQPAAKIIFMGDLNDYPQDNAPQFIAEKLRPQINKSSGEYGGSYKYKGEWDVLDHIMISDGLLNASKKITYVKDSGKILSPEFVMTEVKGQKYPHRTYGREYEGGYSDHLPVRIEVTLK